MAASPEQRIAAVFVFLLFILVGALFGCLFYFSIFYTPTCVTVALLSARGLGAAEQQTTTVEFHVAIGFLHLGKDSAVAHDGGRVTISYSGVKLAEGPVPEFYVAGAGGGVEPPAMRAVATAQAPLSQRFRDYLQVRQQLDGEPAEFEVHLSFFDAHDMVTGDTKRSDYYCEAGLAPQGKQAAAAATICGEAESFPTSYFDEETRARRPSGCGVRPDATPAPASNS